jgi:hypothetical protein
MLNQFKHLRANSHILIAIEALLHSKDVFVSTFLLTYLARLSASANPIAFGLYEIAGYTVMGFAALALAPVIRKHKLAYYRLGILFEVVQITLIATLGGHVNDFLLLLAFINGMGSTFFWRPNAFFSITEIPNRRRISFETKKAIFGSLAKIASPIILGLIISDTTYSATANIILVITLAQLALSLLLKPTAKIKTAPKSANLLQVLRQMLSLKSIRQIMFLHFLRGALVSGSAILVVVTTITNNTFHSDADIGAFTTVAAIFSTALLLLYGKQPLKDSKYSRCLSLISAPLAVLPVIIFVLYPTPAMTAVCYISTLALVKTFLNTICTVRVHNVLNAEHKIHQTLFEAEAVMEAFLCLGRVLSLLIMVAFSLLFSADQLPLLALAFTFLALPLGLTLYRLKPLNHTPALK